MSKKKEPNLKEMVLTKIDELHSRGREEMAMELVELLDEYDRQIYESRRKTWRGLLVTNNPDNYVKLISEFWDIKISKTNGDSIDIKYDEDGNIEYIDSDHRWRDGTVHPYRLIPLEGHEKFYGESARESKLAKKAYKEKKKENAEQSKKFWDKLVNHL